MPISDQFAYAKAQGWLPYFAKAAKDYDFEPSLLMAIASRESNMRNIVGDGGHGFSLMQIDVRSFPDFCHSGQWKNVALAIQKGAQTLDAKRTEIEHGEGDHLVVGASPFVGAKVKSADDLIRVSVSAYNCGLWAFYNYSTGHDPDRFTTGKDYSHDVLARQVQFAALLNTETGAPQFDLSTDAGVQGALKALGYGDCPTAQAYTLAVRSFQRHALISVDGIVGDETRGALSSALRAL